MRAPNINGDAFDDEQREAHRLKKGRETNFAEGTTLQQEISRKPGLVDAGFGSADLLIQARASSVSMKQWGCCDQGFRILYTLIDQVRNVLAHWTDMTLLILDPDVKRCNLVELTSFQGAPCPQHRQEHFRWWYAMLTMSVRKLKSLLGGGKGTPKDEAVREWLVEAACCVRRRWFPVNTLRIGTVQDLLDVNELLPHPSAGQFYGATAVRSARTTWRRARCSRL